MFASIPFPDISPEIVSVTILGRTIALRWYAMAYVVGIALGWQLIKLALRRPHLWRNGPPMQISQLEDLLTYIVVGVIGGGRLGYVLVYKPAEYLTRPFDILKIWEGGLSFHGGFIGVIVGVFLFSRRKNVPLPDLADIGTTGTDRDSLNPRSSRVSLCRARLSIILAASTTRLPAALAASMTCSANTSPFSRRVASNTQSTPINMNLMVHPSIVSGDSE